MRVGEGERGRERGRERGLTLDLFTDIQNISTNIRLVTGKVVGKDSSSLVCFQIFVLSCVVLRAGQVCPGMFSL